MGNEGTGSAESSNPGSHLGIHQRLRLPSGSLYEHIGGLQYRMSAPLGAEGGYCVSAYAGESSCIRIFRPAGSDNVEAILFLPKPDNARLQDIQSGLLERLGIIERSFPLKPEGIDSVNQLSDKCALYSNAADAFTGASPVVDGSLYNLIRQYSDSLKPKYEQEGEKLGRAVGAGVGGVASVAASALMLAGMSEPKLEHIIVAAVYTVASMYVGSKFCGWGFGRSAKQDAHELLRKRLLKGHKDETHLHHVAKFIQQDYQNTDPLKTRDQALDSALSSLARTPAGEGLMIHWKDLPYDKIIERCEMLLGVKRVNHLPEGRAEVISVPQGTPASIEFIVTELPAESSVEPQVRVAFSAPASKCPHCHDEFSAGDSCITGLLNGAHSQAHAECSGEMISSSGDWQPISGAYAYESLVDHTSNQQDRKKDERRVKE